MKNELTLEQAIILVKKGRIVYPVVQNGQLIKIFHYPTYAHKFCLSMGTPDIIGLGYTKDSGNFCISYNISHPKCPRFLKFRLGYLEQLDLFLDIPFKD